MARYDRISLGKYIKKVRLRKKLRQSDLEEEGVLSQSTISNIENGKHVPEEKLNYLLEKLKIPKRNISKYLLTEESEEEIKQNKIEEYQLRLLSIETIIDLSSPKVGLEKLKELSIPTNHELNVNVCFLKGKSYYHLKNWTKSHKYFFDAIQLIDYRYPNTIFSNIKAACYHELSRIEYSLNNLQQAVKYSSIGIQAFVEEGERQYYKPLLLICKAIYLQKLNQFEDANSILEKLAEYNKQNNMINKITSSEITLNAIELQATIQANWKMYSKAIDNALKGIELARIDRMYDRCFELWTTLGKIYTAQNKFNFAEICFLTALKLKKHIKREYLLSYASIQLGTLYYLQEKIESAKKHFLKALQHSKKANDVFLETEALTSIGKCYYKQNNLKAAFKYLKNALELAKKHSLVDQKHFLLLFIGNILNESRDSDYQNYVNEFFQLHLNSIKKERRRMELNPYLTQRDTSADPPGG